MLMNTSNYIKISLTCLFLSTFTLCLGWLPIGAMIPQLVLLFATLLFSSMTIGVKSVIFYNIFFVYQTLALTMSGSPLDIVTLLARYFTIGLPLFVSVYLFNRDNKKDYISVAKYALIVSSITILLTIRVLVSDGSALRMTSYANSLGDMTLLYGFWRQGVADYGMAAMMMFMPVILLEIHRTYKQRNIKYLCAAGIVMLFGFLYLGQVTTPFLFAIPLFILALNPQYQRLKFVIPIIMVFSLIFVFLQDLLSFAISNTADSAMNEKFVAMSMMSKGESVDDASDAGIRLQLLSGTINAIKQNPLFGNPLNEHGGHNYFLDIIAQYGFLGLTLFLTMIISQVKLISKRLSDNSRKVYLLIVISFFLYGLIKNISGTEWWTYLFIYYPAILKWLDLKKQNII